MSKRLWLVLLALLAVCTVALVVYFAWPRKPKEDVVRIAYLPSSSCLPLFVALEKGYFREAHIEVETLRFGATNDALNAVLAGRADGTPGFGISSFCAIEANNPGALKLYLPCMEDASNYANNLLVPVSSPIHSIDQLAGKRVGTFTSSTQVLYLKMIMASALPGGQQWSIVQVDEKLQLQALSAGQFDALFAIEPMGSKAVQDGLAKVLIPNPRCKYLFSPFPAGANCFSTQFVQQKPDLAARVATVFERAAQFIRDNPDAARAMLPKYTPIDATVAPKVGLYAWSLPGQEDWGAVQRLANLMYKEKLLSSPVEVRRMLYGPAARSATQP